MKLHQTKYATLTTEELVRLADSRKSDLGDLGCELLYRIEELLTMLDACKCEA